MRGYFGIGIFNPKIEMNIGTLWRSAYQLGAAFIFTIGRRYKRQPSDIPKTWRHIPLFEYKDWQAFVRARPYSCPVVGIEIGDGNRPLATFRHPERSIYLLGAEDYGLPPAIQAECQHLIQIESIRRASFNVAVAGSLVMYSRLLDRAPNKKHYV